MTTPARMVGNSVSAPMAEALVRVNLPELCGQERIAA